MDRSMAFVRLKDTGDVEAQIDSLAVKQCSGVDTIKVTTTATKCSWNVYSTAKLPKSAQVSNRAQLIDTSSKGCTFRIGSAIFLPQSSSSPTIFKPFTAPKMSLYIDSIFQRGPYLFVTSRQDVTVIPEPPKGVELAVTDTDSQSKVTEKDVENRTEASAKSSTSPEGAATKVKPAAEKTDFSDDEDDSADKISQPSDDSSNELSADESWSEGSTEYDFDQKLREFNPRRPPQARMKTSSDSESGDQESNSDDASSVDSDLDENLLEGSDQEGAGLDSDQEDQWWDDFDNDNGWDHPDFNNQEDNASDVEEEDDDYPNFRDGGWSYEDAYQPMGSDSEECSECGDDGGACAMSSKNNTKPATKDEHDEEAEEPIGTPVSQIHVYNISTTDGQRDDDDDDDDDDDAAPKRLFHFKRPVGQVLVSSPPAVHPTQSLLVWPLGNNRILFADYEANTYFVRKFQTSQFWSSHILINCKFSDDGKQLYVVAVEKSGKPPALPMKKKTKSAEKAKEETSKQKKEAPKYELIISTYRVSESKTTKVPPTLVKRIQRDLGELNVLPTVVWKAGHVYVSFTKKTECHTYEVDLRDRPVEKTRPIKQGKMIMRHLQTDLPKWASDREVRFTPAGNASEGGQLVILAEATKFASYQAAKTKDLDTTTKMSTPGDKVNVAPNVDKASADAHTPKETPDGSADSGKVEGSSTIDAKHTDIEEIISFTEDQSTVSRAQDSTSNGGSNIASSTPLDEQTDQNRGEVGKKEEKPKSIHPETMVATLSAADIESMGGWRDAHNVTATELTAGDGSKRMLELVFEPAIRSIDIQVDH